MEDEAEIITQTENLSLFIESPVETISPQEETPGFELYIAIIGLLFVTNYFTKRRKQI